MAVLVLCESADSEEIVANGPGSVLIRRRPRFRVYHRLVQELRFSHEAKYRRYFRMDAATLDELLTMVGPWRRRHYLIFRTTSRMKLEVVLCCATCFVRLATM